jgi:hypothetical protein
MRSIKDFSDDELNTLEARYRSLNKTEGGLFPLKDIMLEKLRRKPSAFGTRETAAKIVELSAKSDDGFLTYGDIWKHFRPSTPWEGHKTLRIVADCLGRVVHYCVGNGLPILTVLVVRESTRRLSHQAVQNIYDECRELGLDVGDNPEAFIRTQAELSRALVIDQLPADVP